MPTSKIKAESGTFKLPGYPAQLRILSPLPDNDRAYALIGRIAAEWAPMSSIS